MIDLHTHILPNMDDGSKSVEESEQMLCELKQQGVTTIVATPHFYADRDDPKAFLGDREKAYQRLLMKIQEFDNKNELPEIILGSEVAYFEGMSDCDDLVSLKIEGTKLLLLEKPTIPWNERMISEVVAIYEKTGLVPVIAHIDRYIRVFNS